MLLDALELFACNPEVTTGLAKCLLHILQLAPEKTFTSFKTLDAIPRVVKVTCIQAQESKKPESKRSSSQISKKSKSPENVRGWRDSMEACMQLFAEFFSVTEEAKFLVLNSSTCIDCLFDLFWEECLRSSMLSYIFALMKVYFLVSSSLYSIYICVFAYQCLFLYSTLADHSIFRRRPKGKVILMFQILGNLYTSQRKGEKLCKTIN